MVCNWHPDPPRGLEERMSVPSQVVEVDSEDSEDDMLGSAPPGYELLPQGPVLGLPSDEEEQSDVETPEVTARGETRTNPSTDIPSTSDAQGRRRSEVAEVVSLYQSPQLRPPLELDCEAVRAAMAGVVLPPSSYPSWASDVPEEQWTATLSEHIQRIQGADSSTGQH